MYSVHTVRYTFGDPVLVYTVQYIEVTDGDFHKRVKNYTILQNPPAQWSPARAISQEIFLHTEDKKSPVSVTARADWVPLNVIPGLESVPNNDKVTNCL